MTRLLPIVALLALLVSCTGRVTHAPMVTHTPAATEAPTATPTPTPPPEPPPPPPPPPPLDIKALICSYPWPCEEALTVVYGPTPWCPNGESAGDPGALGDYFGGTEPNSFGLFQVYYPVHFAVVGPDPYVLLDPETNVRIAYGIYLDGLRYWGDGWRPWSCAPYVPRLLMELGRIAA